MVAKTRHWRVKIRVDIMQNACSFCDDRSVHLQSRGNRGRPNEGDAPKKQGRPTTAAAAAAARARRPEGARSRRPEGRGGGRPRN